MSAAAGLRLTSRPGGLVFGVHLQPKAQKDEIVAVREGMLWVRVAAPPVGGKANRSCLEFLASGLGISISSLALLGGMHARHKTVQISGLPAAELLSRIDALLGGRQ